MFHNEISTNLAIGGYNPLKRTHILERCASLNKMLNKNLQYRIEDSFQGVILEDGTGYFQSIAMDNLGGNDEFLIAMKKDKEFGNDWMKLKNYIQVNDLDWFPYEFMDPKGIRFLLPTLLTLEFKFTLNRIMKKMLLDEKLSKDDIWNDFLNIKQRKIIKEVYKFWHNENLESLTSCGMSEAIALKELRKNKSLNVENYNIEILEILELLEQKTNAQHGI